MAQPSRTRGRPARPGLNRDLVIAAAISVADAEGIDAVTLRRLAEEIGVHPTSIYNHVESKEAILDGMIEALLVEAALPHTVPDWRTWVREFAGAVRRTARAHPGAFGVFLRSAGTGPVAAEHIESALDAFRRVGCTVEQAARAVQGVQLAALGLAIDEASVSATAAPTVAPSLEHLSPATHPRIFEVEAAGLLPASSDPTWDLLIESIVVGLEVTLGLPKSRQRGR